MFTHKGNKRTYHHNLRLASLLSFVAGIVNITGVLSLGILTTNVTGHFAFFSRELVGENYKNAFSFLVFIFSFLLGAFVSNLLVEIGIRIKPRAAHAFPVIIEMIILSVIGLFVPATIPAGKFIACLLLFSMGIQNSLVTKVSDSVVRTTHLTGLFTDLGIELSQLFFFRHPNELKKLKKSIFLRSLIILFFFAGGIVGGYLFKVIYLKAILLAVAVLLIALFYNQLLYFLFYLKRRLGNH